MAKSTAKPPLPWENRWDEPTLEQLLEPQKPHMRELFQMLMDQVLELPNVQRHIVWYGSAWKWTIELTLHDEAGEELEKLVYLVPNPEHPTISIPLQDGLAQQLSNKRLNKYIRDGLRSAKCAVELHWTWWTPSARSEVEHLVDLVKRKHKFTVEGGGESGASSKGRKKS